MILSPRQKLTPYANLMGAGLWPAPKLSYRLQSRRALPSPSLKWPVLLFLFLASLFFSSTLWPFSLTPTTQTYITQTYGPEAWQRVLNWAQLIQSSPRYNELEKLRAVTDFFNQIPYQLDSTIWQKENFWANPLELLGKNAGDCEDFAIAKYLTLKAMGVSGQKMRIVYVVAGKLKAPHMVLAYYETPQSPPLILDNLTPRILYASERPDLRPIYMFSEQAIWISQPQSSPKEVLSGVQIYGWKQLILRMKTEGLTEDTFSP